MIDVLEEDSPMARFTVGDEAIRNDSHMGGNPKYREGYSFIVRKIVPDFEGFGAGHCYLVDDDGEYHADVACRKAEPGSRPEDG